MSRVILINPDYYSDIFTNSKARSAISPGVIPLGLACIASGLIKNNHDVKVLDLNILDNPDVYLQKEIREFKPHFVGITSTTPLIRKAYRIAKAVKEINKDIFIIAGGAHPSALPKDVLMESDIDCVVKGEGDFALKSIVEDPTTNNSGNIFFKRNGCVSQSPAEGHFIEDLDNLPFPAYELFDIKQYHQPRISSRKAPLAYLETSRGCYGRCIFCNKNIHGYKMRMKSPLRVVDEMERALKMGFNEIQIIDDIFTADMNRAYKICQEILKRKLKFPWYPRGGIRVDRVNLELLKIMKRAGCYRIPFGIESGSQRILDVIKKGITLQQAQNAVSLAKRAGLETECYFMLGLPTEQEDDIKKTIDFAIRLNPDYAKFAVTIPLPGTSLFESMSASHQIKNTEWHKYNFSTSPGDIYDHDNLSWEVIDNYYHISHRAFYFRPGYIFRIFYKSLIRGTFFAHLKAFFKTDW